MKYLDLQLFLHSSSFLISNTLSIKLK